MLHGVGETGTLLRRVKVGYIGQFLVIDTGGHREAEGQEGEVSFHSCKDVMVSISLTMMSFVWMHLVGQKTRKGFTSNVKAFTDEPRKVKCNQSCKVAGCGLRPKSALQYTPEGILTKNATRNFHGFMFFALYLYTTYILYIYYYICIYIYILYII